MKRRATERFAPVAAVIALFVLVYCGPATRLLSATSGDSPPREGQAKDANGVSVRPPADESSVVVGKIGDYTITRDELRQRLLTEVRPRSEEYTGREELPTAESVLRTMVAEKAMIMEGRKQGLLSDQILSNYVERTRQRKLVGMVLMDYLSRNMSIEESDIDRAQKANPKLTREQAKVRAQQTKAKPLLERFYKELVEKLQVKRVKENFAKASKIHDRLLHKPAEPRRETWIRNSQIRNELSREEKNIALATYKGGQVTLEDWFKTLGDIVPPRRPRDLGTPAGVEKLLDRTLRPAIFAAEARARGFHKNEELLREIRELEDRSLLGKVRGEKMRDVPEPNDAQIKAYFDAHPEQFAKSASLKVEQFWCDDLKTARKARAMLADGADFAAAKKACSSDDSDRPITLYPSGEGPFWDELSKGEPNEVVGPVKGFHGPGIAWRMVNILEKTPAEMQPYSDNVKNRAKWALHAERRESLLDAYEKQLLEKYPHKIYAKRIKDIDPLAVTAPAKTAR